MSPPVPIWRLTRSRPVRRVYDGLAASGVRFSMLDRFEREVADAPPEAPGGPPSVRIEVVDASERPESWNTSNPGLESDHLVLAALSEDRLVGKALLATAGPGYVSELDRTVDFGGGYLWGLSVDADWRRQGIASALLDTALLHLHDGGVPRATALVAPDNHPSRALFRRAGFSPEGRHVYVSALGLTYRSSRNDAGE